MDERTKKETETGARAGGEDERAAPDASVVRHEEKLEVGRTAREAGALHVRKRVVSDNIDELAPRSVEHFDEVERTDAYADDSGEIEVLPDGSVSVPILEEELVVTKRTVVRERVIVRKRTETRQERIEAELRREEVDVDAEGDVDVADERA